MTITIPYQFTDMSITTKLNGDLVLEVTNNQKLIRDLLLDVLEHTHTETLMYVLSPNQIAEIKRYKEE